MKELRLISIAATLLLTIAPAAGAQDQQSEDHARRTIARNEAKHAASRRNLNKILLAQPHFWPELQAIAVRLKTEPAWLLNVLACESLFNPAARNSLPGQTASGLLQFIESTARWMGTTTSAIRRMTPVDQLALVEKYLTPFSGRLNSLADVYLAVFRGFILEGGEATVVAPLDNSKREQRVYSLNKGLDLNGDSQITKAELALAALSVGRFQPSETIAPHQEQNLTPTSSEALSSPERKPSPRTQSIYIRSPQPAP